MVKNRAQSPCGQSFFEAVLDEQSVCWGRGERPLAEDFLQRFPELRDTPDAALDVVDRKSVV